MKSLARPGSRRAVLEALTIGVGALALPVCARAAGHRLQVEAFRARRGTDLDTVKRALDEVKRGGGGVLELAAGRVYNFGKVHPSNPVFHLQDFRDVEIRGNGARLVCETVGVGKTQMFLIQRCSNLHFTDLVASDVGADLRVDWKGMDFVHIESTAGSSDRISLNAIVVDGAVSLLTCSGLGDSPRSRTIRLTNVEARNCYYGLNFQENGDDLIGDLKAVNCRRAYFPYGVTNHRIGLDVHHDGVLPGADGCIVISRILRDTSNISVAARFSGSLPWSNLVHVIHQPRGPESGVIQDIDIELHVAADCKDPYSAARLALTSYREGRPLAQSNDRWRNIRLSGCYAARGRPPIVHRTRSARAVGVEVSNESCA